MSEIKSDNPDEITQAQIDDLREQCALAEKRAAETNDLNWRLIAQASRQTLQKWEAEIKSKE